MSGFTRRRFLGVGATGIAMSSSIISCTAGGRAPTASIALELPTGTPKEAGMSVAGLKNISDVVNQHITQGKIPGAVVGVARHGKIAYLEALGVMDEQTGAPMQTDALFQMFSSTKPVLGVAAMQTIEQGGFKPSDEVSTYIPEFKDIKVAVLKDPADKDISPDYVIDDVPAHRLVDLNRPITIHDLLTHTSGLGSYGLGSAVAEWNWEKSETLATWIPKIAAGPLDFQPGSRWQYSPMFGLDVVARIIEIVTDTPFNEVVQRGIFDPLNMQDTHWNLPESKKSRQVVVRKDAGKKDLKKSADKDQKKDNGKEASQASKDYFSGSVGLISTARDYLNFEQMLLNRGTLFGNRVLQESSVKTMSTNKVGKLFGKGGKDSGGSSFGYTVEITENPSNTTNGRSKGAFGWAGALGTISWNEPEHDLTAAIMVQKPTKDLSDDVSKAITAAIDG